MSHSSLSPQIHAVDWLAPMTRQAIQFAGQEATRWRTSHIYPEHLLLGILTLTENRATLLLQDAGLSYATVSKLVKDLFAPPPMPRAENDLPLAPEALECINRAITLLTYDHTQPRYSNQVSPEILLLSIFYHPRMQKLFGPYASTIIATRERLIEDMEPRFIRFMEQVFLLSERFKHGERTVVSYVHVQGGKGRRILTYTEYTNITFKDIPGLLQVKRELQELIVFLRNPDHVQLSSRGILLQHRREHDPRQLIRAVAGEAEVIISILSCSVLIELLLEVAGDTEKLRARIQEIFLPLKLLSRCLIFLDNVDSIIPDQSIQGQEQILQHFLPEIDALLALPGIILIASTCSREKLPQDLQKPDRFHRCIALTEAVQFTQRGVVPGLEKVSPERPIVQKAPVVPAAPAQKAHVAHFCHACEMAVQPHWRYCIYCRAALPRTCRKCGAPYPNIKAARYCFKCGHNLFTS